MMNKLIKRIEACTLCKEHLPNAPKPIVRFSKKSKIIIIGQAPGQKVHDTEISFKDKSGNELRKWLGVTEEQFYDTSLFGIIPMGFCFPGSRKGGGDLAPRKECATKWHQTIFDYFDQVELVLVIGTYAINYYLKDTKKRNLTETVKSYEEYLDKGFFPLVHPSPLNFRWHSKNPWFKSNIVPVLALSIQNIIHSSNNN